GAGALPDGGSIPVANTAPDVNLDEVLSSLDTDTRTYLEILLNAGGQSLSGTNTTADLRGTLKRFYPTNKDLAKITGLLAPRRDARGDPPVPPQHDARDPRPAAPVRPRRAPAGAPAADRGTEPEAAHTAPDQHLQGRQLAAERAGLQPAGTGRGLPLLGLVG